MVNQLSIPFRLQRNDEIRLKSVERLQAGFTVRNMRAEQLFRQFPLLQPPLVAPLQVVTSSAIVSLLSAGAESLRVLRRLVVYQRLCQVKYRGRLF